MSTYFTHEEIYLVSTSFAKVASMPDEAAAMFYARLYEIAPDTKELFTGADMKAQGMKLMQTIAAAVAALDRVDTVMPDVKALGQRHIDYGVTKEQYEPVGEALIWALEQAIGDKFTDAHRAAWAKVYGLLAEVATSSYDEQQKPTN